MEGKDNILAKKLCVYIYIYCRIGIYRRYKDFAKSRFFVFSHVLYFACEHVLQRHLLNQTVILKMQTFGGHLAAIIWQKFQQNWTGKHAIYNMIPWKLQIHVLP